MFILVLGGYLVLLVKLQLTCVDYITNVVMLNRHLVLLVLAALVICVGYMKSGGALCTASVSGPIKIPNPFPSLLKFQTLSHPY